MLDVVLVEYVVEEVQRRERTAMALAAGPCSAWASPHLIRFYRCRAINADRIIACLFGRQCFKLQSFSLQIVYSPN
jgi:hypothetical protein